MKYIINTSICIEKRFNYFDLPLKIHSYVLVYICIPSKYITLPFKTIHTFDIYYNTITTLQYPSIYVETVMRPLYFAPLCRVTNTIFKTVLAPHYSTKMSCTCYDMFTGIQK
jgi:hypothetical protein